MACERQSQAFPRISQESVSSWGLFHQASPWLPGFSVFLWYQPRHRIQLSLVNSKTPPTFIMGAFWYTFLNLGRGRIVVCRPPAPGLSGSNPPPCPSPSVISLPLLRSHKHIPRPASCRGCCSYQGLGRPPLQPEYLPRKFSKEIACSSGKKFWWIHFFLHAIKSNYLITFDLIVLILTLTGMWTKVNFGRKCGGKEEGMKAWKKWKA